MCFDYPQAWKLTGGRERSQSLDFDYDNVMLRDENDAQQLTLFTGISGLGGVCLEENDLPYYVIATEATKLSASSSRDDEDRTVYAVKSVWEDGATKRWVASMHLSAAVEEQKITQLRTCQAAYNNVISAKTTTFGNDTMAAPGLVFDNLASYQNLSDKKTYTSRSDAEAALQTDSARKAYYVIKSVHY